MGWFSRRKESDRRKALREEFEATTKLLALSAATQQVAVGDCINLVTSAFATRYPSLDDFERAAREEQLQYLATLTAMERELNAKEVGSGLGVGLFKMWLGAVVARDEPLVDAFSQELARLSAMAVSVREATGP